MAVDRRSTRLGVLALVGLILVSALGTRLWFLQAVQAEGFQASVDRSKIRTVSIAPERGRIFDADGRVLADNQRVLTVTVERAVMRRTANRTALFERLSGPLDKPVADLEERYENGLKMSDPLLPMPLVQDVDEGVVQYLLERGEDFPGVNVIEEYRRVYPYAPIASHVIGYMGQLNADNVDEYKAKGYNLNERVGQFGVEASMESVLHGAWVLAGAPGVAERLAPVGVLAAVYLNEYARDTWLTRIIQVAVINLAGVPSIVHALFGLGAFVLAAGLGQSILAASLTLAVMTLPVIIASTSEALSSVPRSFREACWNVGATR
jgi:hypothetical protein